VAAVATCPLAQQYGVLLGAKVDTGGCVGGGGGHSNGTQHDMLQVVAGCCSMACSASRWDTGEGRPGKQHLVIIVFDQAYFAALCGWALQFGIKVETGEGRPEH
jgi:hypothetical protein